MGRVLRMPVYTPNRVAAPGGNVDQITAPTQGTQAVGRLGAQVNQYLEQQFAQQDETAVKDLVTQAEAEARRVYYGEGQSQGISTMQGKAALTAIPKVRESLEEIRNRYSGAAGNPRQRQMFADAWGARAANYDENLLRMEATETERNTAAVAMAEFQSNIEQAAVAQTPKEAAVFIALGRQNYEAELRRRGVPPEAWAMEIKSAMSGAHQRIIAGLMANNDTAGAIAHLNTYAPEIEDQYEATLRPRLEAARTHDLAYARAMVAVQNGEDPLKVATEFKDPDAAQKFLQFHTSLDGIKRRQRADDEASMERQIETAILVEGRELTGTEYAAAVAAGKGEKVAQLRKLAVEGRLPVKGSVAYWTVERRLFEDPTVAAMTVPELRNWATKNELVLHPDDWKDIETRLASKGKETRDGSLSAANDITTKAMRLIAVYRPGMKPKERDEITGQIMQFVGEEVRVATDGGKKLLPPSEITRIAELAASRGGTKDTPFGADPAAQTEYREDPARWGGLLNRLSATGIGPQGVITGETPRANRREQLKVIERVEGGKPAYKAKEIPKFFLDALADDFLPLTDAEKEAAYTDWLMRGRILSLPQSRRKGYASPGHAASAPVELMGGPRR